MSANALVGSMNCCGALVSKYFDIGLALRPYCVPGLRYLFYGESAFRQNRHERKF
jgi:hypothetical protein